MKRWEAYCHDGEAMLFPIDEENGLGRRAIGSPVYLVADVEAANGWRYDEPGRPGEYLVSWRGPHGAKLTVAEWRISYFGKLRWNLDNVYAWLPLPRPAPEQSTSSTPREVRNAEPEARTPVPDE